MRAARMLYDELAHAGFSAIEEWDQLPVSNRESFADCIEGLLMHWEELLSARAELEHD